MRKSLVNIWVAAGGPSIGELSQVLNVDAIDLFKILRGEIEPDDSVKQKLSDAFGRPIAQLFPPDE